MLSPHLLADGPPRDPLPFDGADEARGIVAAFLRDPFHRAALADCVARWTHAPETTRGLSRDLLALLEDMAAGWRR